MDTRYKEGREELKGKTKKGRNDRRRNKERKKKEETKYIRKGGRNTVAPIYCDRSIVIV